MSMVCDPCQFCACLYDDSDPSVGYYGTGCSFYDTDATLDDDEWEPGCGRPCRGFAPIPVSESLYEILYNEQLAEEYKEEEE